MKRKSFVPVFASSLVCALLLATGCNSGPKYDVHSHVQGTLKVRAEVDSSADYSGFRISVLTQTEGDVDTLATAVTERDGMFAFDVHAQDEGVYPIVVERLGTTLSMDDIVIVDGDSVKVSGSYPLGAAGLRIVSSENAAWSAYRNAKAGHNQQMVDLLKSNGYTSNDVGRITAQTSAILWSIPASYPGTIGGELSMAESVVMMEGWNDSTVVARFPEISLDNSNIVAVIRAARRSTARLSGQDSSIALLDAYLTKTADSYHAEIMAEKIVAFADSFMTADAVRVATELKKKYPESEWAKWAGLATYELENLQPGMNAPAYTLTSREGVALSTSGMGGKFVILEFFDPSEQIFQREFEARDGITTALDDRLFETISVSVEPDSVVNEALFDGTTHPGHFVWMADGMNAQVVKDFNVQILPTRYLIDPEGVIVAKYSGPAIGSLEQDLVSIVTGLNGLTSTSTE